MIDKSTVEVYFHKTKKYPNNAPIPQNSWKLTEWIAKNSILRGNAKLVAMQVASYYNPKLGYSYPTYTDLINKTGLGYGTVSRAIKEMKLSGEWIVISAAWSQESRHTNNRYYYIGATEERVIMPHLSYKPETFGKPEEAEEFEATGEVAEIESTEETEDTTNESNLDIDERPPNRSYTKPVAPSRKHNKIGDYNKSINGTRTGWMRWKP